MRGDAKNLAQIFVSCGQSRFYIPVYQRNYDWKIEHCQRLFDDIEELIRTQRGSHFFGSLVSQAVPMEIGSRILIDGQQRITSCFLLLFAIIHQVQNGKIVRGETDVVSKISEMYLINKFSPEEKRIRLKPIKKDLEAFNRIADGKADLVEASNITANYRYFLKRCEETEFTAEQLEQAFQQLVVIDIVLEERDDAQLIFESLNSTGLELSEGDKIRNFVLMPLPMSEQDSYYDKYWAEIERLVDLRPADNYEISAFIRDYLAVKNRKTPSWARIYSEYRKYFAKARLSLTEHFEDLLEYAELFSAIHAADLGNREIDRVQRRLNLLGMTVITPFLFALYKYWRDGGIDDAAVVSVLKTIETYLFRRFVCKEPANALNKIFETLHSETLKGCADGDAYADVMTYILLHKEGGGLFPSDEVFLKAFGERDFYHIQTNRFYLFDRLENGDSLERVDVVRRLEDGTFTIEHIMPQTLSNAWKRQLGPEYETIHEQWLHRLANVTLTAYNSSYSNATFVEKRDASNGFKDSGFRINAFVKEQAQWGVPELECRTAELKQKALQLWPMPETSYQPPATIHEEASLGDGGDALMGRKIAAYTFMGARYSVKTWVEMSVGVLRQLNQSFPAELQTLAEEKDFPGSMLERVEVDGCLQIADNLWAYLSTSTSMKIAMLSKIFSRCGLEDSELMFELYRDVNARVEE